MRLIDADALIAYWEEKVTFGECAKWEAQQIIDAIEYAPPRVYVDAVSVVHGEWIEDYNNTYSRRRMKCSVCGKFSGIGGIKSNQLKPYCPNCGARMKTEDNERDYERAIEQMQHDMLYEPTYNPEDGSM